MSVFDVDTTTIPYEGLTNLIHKIALACVECCKRDYVYVTEQKIYDMMYSTFSWGREFLEEKGMLEGDLPITRVTRLSFWRIRKLLNKPIFHITVELQVSETSGYIKVFDKDV